MDRECLWWGTRGPHRATVDRSAGNCENEKWQLFEMVRQCHLLTSSTRVVEFLWFVVTSIRSSNDTPKPSFNTGPITSYHFQSCSFHRSPTTVGHPPYFWIISAIGWMPRFSIVSKSKHALLNALAIAKGFESLAVGSSLMIARNCSCTLSWTVTNDITAICSSGITVSRKNLPHANS